MSEEFIQGEIAINIGKVYSKHYKYIDYTLRFFKMDEKIAVVYFHHSSKSYVVSISDGYSLTIPTALPVGKYDVIIYLQAGSDPANTDDVALQYATVKGSIFGF